jgi:hypothetical protein
MRAIIWAIIVLAVAVGGAAWWLGPGWNLGQAIDRAATPLAQMPSAATAVAMMPTAPSRPTTASPATPPAPSATTTPEPGTQVVTATEDEVNAYLSTATFGQELANTPFGTVTVEAMRVRFTVGEITVTGAARGGPRRLAFAIGGTMITDNGMVRVVVRSMKVNEMQLPVAMRAGVEQALSTQIGAALNADGARISAVDVRDGAVTVRMARAAS